MKPKIKTIRSSWWEGYGYRLDCQPYLAGGLEALLVLEKTKLHKDPLGSLTMGYEGGIYFAGRDSVQWVESPKFGIPFLRGKDISLSDFTSLPLISRRQVKNNPMFLVKRGMTLITRSGTIGTTIYVREEMDGMASSDPLRVVADPAKILPGYLFAFLSSRYGIPLVASGTYGAIIQHLEAKDIAKIPVPRLGEKKEQEIHKLVEKAAELRTVASRTIQKAKEEILNHFGKPVLPSNGQRHPKSSGIAIQKAKIIENGRFDSFFYNPIATDVERWVENNSAGFWRLEEIADVFDVPPFKHIYVEADHGIGFFTSADLFQLNKKPNKYLSISKTKGLDKYILKEGWILVARSGSLGGNIGYPQYADSAMDRKAASDHVIRIIPNKTGCSPGYLYAYLSLKEIGYPLLLRTASGAAVPALWPLYLNRLKVLKPPRFLNEKVGETIVAAFESRVKATNIEDQARALLESCLNKISQGNIAN